MQERNMPANSLTGEYAEGERLLAACGLWLLAGFVGASILVASLLPLVGGQAMPLSAFASAFGGGALAVFAWRRARIVLDGANTRVATASSPGGMRQASAPALALGREATLATE